MSKSTGLGSRLFIGGRDVSNDTSTVAISSPCAVLEFTGIDKSAHERKTGLRDGNINVTSYFNPLNAHLTYSALPTSDVQTAWGYGAAIGNPIACLVAKQLNYDPTRGADGMLTAAVQTQANGFGLEWGNYLTAGLRTDTAATNGASWDTGAALSFGAQAYMQCTAFTGTDVTIKIQDSADNATFADVTGLTFTAVTAAPASQRLATSNTATIRRYLRVATTTSGGFTSASFVVAINKNPIASVVF